MGPYGNLRVGFEGSATLNRTDYGVSCNAALEAGGVLVSQTVTLELDVEATRQTHAARVRAGSADDPGLVGSAT